MNFKTHLLFLFITILISCKGEKKYFPNDLIKLTENELIERARNRDHPNFEEIVYKNENGEILTLDSVRNLPITKWTSDKYVDDNGVIKEMVIRKATPKDKILRAKLQQAFNHKPPIKLIDIDCEKKEEILEKVYHLDQKMRLSNNHADYDPQIDRQNLIKVVSLIEKCGMPTTKEISQKQMNAIWLVFQHADNSNRKKYFPLLKKAANNGDLSQDQIALMQDRILMKDGKPQIYGSQIRENNVTGKWEIYELKKPELVDKRRAKVGLGPLKEYVKKWSIEFNVKQKE